MTQTQTAPTSGTPSTPTSTVAAGMPVVGAATPASSIEGVPQGDVPGWRENITKDPITTDKYTVQEGDTLSGIAQRWGLGDDRTKNYQDLAKANQGVIGNDPNVIHPGQELTRQT